MLVGVSSSPPLYSRELFTRPSLCGTGTPLCAAHSCMAKPTSACVLDHVSKLCPGVQQEEGKAQAWEVMQAGDRGGDVRQRMAHLDGVPERKVGRELQVAQAHARDWARPIALAQPALDTHSVIGVPRGDHYRVRHQLLQYTVRDDCRQHPCKIRNLNGQASR